MAHLPTSHLTLPKILNAQCFEHIYSQYIRDPAITIVLYLEKNAMNVWFKAYLLMEMLINGILIVK